MDNNQFPVHELEADSPKPKRSWNRIALFLICLGAIMSAAGWLSGSRGGSLALVGGRLEIHSSSRGAGNNEQTFNPGSFTQVNITAGSANVIIIPVTGRNEAYRVTTHGIDNPHVALTNGRLEVSTRQPQGRQRTIHFFNIGFGSSRREIRVYVPHDSLDSLDITVSSGRIQADDINASQINAQVSSGNIQMENITADRLILQSTSGNVRINNAVFSYGNIRTTSGNLRLADVTYDSLRAVATSGGVRVEGARPRASSDTHLSTSSGNVQFDTNARRDSFSFDLSVSSGNIHVDGSRNRDGRQASQIAAATADGNHRLTARASSGNIRVNFGR